MTGTGVILKFVFQFDRTHGRHARVVWRRRLGDRDVDTWYGDIEQSGGAVVLEQVTFPGELWAVLEKDGERLLALHTATQEREQTVVIDAASRSLAQIGRSSNVMDDAGNGPRHGKVAHGASSVLQRGDGRSKSEKHETTTDEVTTVEAACQLSMQLCEAHRAVQRLEAIAAGGAAASTHDQCRLQIVLPDGSRALETLSAGASLVVVAALACVLLAKAQGLVWLAERALPSCEPTHALVCSAPRLRLSMHVCRGLDAANDATLADAGLAPSATLRILEETSGRGQAR